MTHFLDTLPTTENRWRALILLGRNTASYKFALGKALLDRRFTLPQALAEGAGA